MRPTHKGRPSSSPISAQWLRSDYKIEKLRRPRPAPLLPTCLTRDHP